MFDQLNSSTPKTSNDIGKDESTTKQPTPPSAIISSGAISSAETSKKSPAETIFATDKKSVNKEVKTSVEQKSVSSEQTDKEIDEDKAVFYTMPSVGGAMTTHQIKKKTAKPIISKTAPTKKKKNNLKFYLIITVILIVVFGGGLGAFYFWYQQQINSRQIVVPSLPEEQLGEQTPVPIITSLAQLITAEVKDNQQQIISYAALNLPRGAIEVSIKPIINGRLPAVEEIYGENYKVIGGIFSLQPADLSLQKKSTLTISYSMEQIDLRWEKKMIIAYQHNQQWISLPSQINQEKKILTTSLSTLPGSVFALVISKSEIELANKQSEEVVSNFPSSIDTDGDGLTDVEEKLYQCEKDNPDTDGDHYPDGLEIINLYSPIVGPSVKLAISGLVGIYTNPTFGYTIFYPTEWLTRALPESDNEDVLFTAKTGEFVEILVQDNINNLSILDWYIQQNPNLSSQQIKTTTLSGQTAIWNNNRQTIYLTKGDKIYILTYNFGGEEQLNFKSTFLMMLTSFYLKTTEQLTTELLICTNEAICFTQAVNNCLPAIISVNSASGEFVYKKEVLGGRENDCTLRITYLKSPLAETMGKSMICLVPKEDLINYNDYLLGEQAINFCEGDLLPFIK